MAQADYSISNQSFPATRADINSHLEAIATNNSGTSAPSTQYAGQFWIDTTSTTWTLYIHDGADDIQFATIDTSANTVNFIDSELGDNSVTTAKIADGNVTSAKMFSGFANGITEADQWRLTATLNNPGDVDITTNLERVDDATFAKIGTGMTESSGIFTFPSTGLYEVISTWSLVNETDAVVSFWINVSTDSGSTYDDVGRALMGNRSSGTEYNMGTTSAHINVTNASTFRVKFKVDSTTSTTNISGGTDYNLTYFTFIKLGDSQ